MKVIFHGIQLGIVLAFLIGPVFFSIIQTSVEKGFPKGALVALGVSISDTLYVIVCYFGLVHLFENAQFRIYMAYIGGAILISFGVYYLFIKNRRTEGAVKAAAERKAYRYIAKGFVINGLSPMVLVFWIGTISVASLDFGYRRGFEFFLFFAAVLSTVLATDLLKAFLADRLRQLITPASIRVMNILLGIVLIGFGVRLIMLSKTFGIPTQ